MDTRDDGQANGMLPQQSVLSVIPRSIGKLPPRMMRKMKSEQALASSEPSNTPLPREREVSLSLRFGEMSLGEDDPQKQGVQANSKRSIDTTSSSLPRACETPCRLKPGVSPVYEDINQELPDNQIPPGTPASKISRSLHKSFREVKRLIPCSPTKEPLFLNRFSDTKNYIVNDIDEKVGRMDSELQRVKEFMESTEKNSASVREELEASKKRGGCCICH